VVIRLSVRAGAAFDPPDAAGLANLTADLLTRGTAKRTGPELDRAIEFVGGSLEGEAGHDGATISLSVLKKDLALGLDLLAEVLLQPAFPPAELARRSEDIAAYILRSEQDPGTVARGPSPSCSTRGIRTAARCRARPNLSAGSRESRWRRFIGTTTAPTER